MAWLRPCLRSLVASGTVVPTDETSRLGKIFFDYIDDFKFSKDTPDCDKPGLSSQQTAASLSLLMDFPGTLLFLQQEDAPESTSDRSYAEVTDNEDEYDPSKVYPTHSVDDSADNNDHEDETAPASSSTADRDRSTAAQLLKAAIEEVATEEELQQQTEEGSPPSGDQPAENKTLSALIPDSSSSAASYAPKESIKEKDFVPDHEPDTEESGKDQSGSSLPSSTPPPAYSSLPTTDSMDTSEPQEDSSASNNEASVTKKTDTSPNPPEDPGSPHGADDDPDLEIVEEHIVKPAKSKPASVVKKEPVDSDSYWEEEEDPDCPMVKFPANCHALMIDHGARATHPWEEVAHFLSFSKDIELKRTDENSGPAVCADIMSIVFQWTLTRDWECKPCPTALSKRAVLLYYNSRPHTSIHDFEQVVFCLWVMNWMLKDKSAENIALKKHLTGPDFPDLLNRVVGKVANSGNSLGDFNSNN